MYQQIKELVNSIPNTQMHFNDFIIQVNDLLAQNRSSSSTEKKDNNSFNVVITILEGNYECTLCTGFMRELRRCYPQANITLICSINVTLFDDNPNINQILKIDIQAPDMLTALNQILDFLDQKFNNQSVDLAFSLGWPSNSLTTLLNWLIDAKERVGYAENLLNSYIGQPRPKESFMFDQLLTKPIDDSFELTHDVMRKYHILEEMGFNIEDYTLDVNIKAKEFNHKLICVDLDCVLPSWRLPVTKYAEILLQAMELINSNSNEDIYIMINSENANDKKYLTQLLTTNIYQLPSEKKYPLINANYIINYEEALLPNISLYIGNNTAIMHQAAALNKKIVAVFAEAEDKSDNSYLSLYKRQRPYFWLDDDTNYLRIVRPEYAIDHCVNEKFMGGCAYGYPHCIDTIYVETVVNAIKELIY